MKIGILTYHRSHNFGALFQAIASRTYLESLGHEVYYINYWPNYHRAMYSPFSFWLFWKKGLLGKYNYLRSSIKRLPASLKRNKQYSSFIQHYIMPYYAPKGTAFDAIFYGSDQIWRKQPCINDYNPVYFAHNDFKSKKHIALSASAGLLPQTEEEKSRFKSLLARFDKISVREENLKEMIEGFGYKVQLTCDPALFLTAEQWDIVLQHRESKQKGYLLLVNYIENSFNVEEVKRFAQNKGLEYLCINGSAIKHPHKGDECNLSPLQLFDYIRNADFVCTSSFHALVFSILFNKQFFTAFYENSKRAESLLKVLGIEDRLLAPDAIISDEIVPIEYSSLANKLALLRMDTFEYIKRSLNNLEDDK